MIDRERKFTTVLPTPELWDYAAFGKLYPDRKPSSWLQTVKSIHQQADAPIEIFNGGERTNARGISDMFGNVWEWCQPSFVNPGIALLGRPRVPNISTELRGGGYLDNLNQISPFISTSLLENGIETRHTDLGFRMAALINTKDLNKEILAQLWTCKESAEPFVKYYRRYFA
ncbi:MAG: hypothetical protein EOP48_25840 [Sphingobacteriales bacterium]|nr:MAG: hypothetical protein EOP48_25840 [Sphingobacteriales bacterium]